jgi:hypothetical protein
MLAPMASRIEISRRLAAALASSRPERLTHARSRMSPTIPISTSSDWLWVYRSGGMSRHRVGCAEDRQAHGEGTSVSQRARHVDFRVVPLDDPFHQAEAKTGAVL